MSAKISWISAIFLYFLGFVLAIPAIASPPAPAPNSLEPAVPPESEVETAPLLSLVGDDRDWYLKSCQEKKMPSVYFFDLLGPSDSMRRVTDEEANDFVDLLHRGVREFKVEARSHKVFAAMNDDSLEPVSSIASERIVFQLRSLQSFYCVKYQRDRKHYWVPVRVILDSAKFLKI